MTNTIKIGIIYLVTIFVITVCTIVALVMESYLPMFFAMVMVGFVLTGSREIV